MSSRTRNKSHFFVMLLLAPLWVIVAALVLEVGAKIREGHRDQQYIQRALAKVNVHRAADDLVFQEVSALSRPPDSVPWRVPERESLLSLDEEGRFALARERNEIILVCDAVGRISKIYPYDATPELKEISGSLAPGDSIDVLLPPAELADALDSIRQAERGDKPLRDYYVPLLDGSTHLTEFHALRLSASPDTFALFLGDSRFVDFLRRYRPNIYRRNWYMAQFNQSEFWTNSHGFRDREIAIPKPAGMVRILCIGGSTTVEGPHNALTYPKILEGLFREHFKTTAIEVINCGVDGMAFPGELERMDDWLGLEPDVIVHYNIINNASWMIQSAMAKAAGEDGFARRIATLLSRSKLLAGRNFFSPYPERSYYVDELNNLAISCLEEMTEIARKNGTAMAVASFALPDSEHISNAERRFFESTFHLTPAKGGDLGELQRFVSEYNRLVRALCNDRGALYIPVAEKLSGGIETFTDVCHLRLPGIHTKAEIMFEHLREYVGGLFRNTTDDSTLM